MILAELIFSSPVVLIGVIFAVIPLILHLFGRTKAKTVKFPMMRFVKQAALKTYHRRKIENLALLLARIAMFGLVPIALALPFYRSQNLQFARSENLATAIIIDNTASMKQNTNNKTKSRSTTKAISAFEQAKIEALRLLRGTKQFPSPRLGIIITPIGQLNRNPAISTDITKLALQIRKLKCSDAETEITTTIIQAANILKSQPYANKLIYVLCDCQKTHFDINQLSHLQTQNIPIVVMKTISDIQKNDNIGISGIKVSPPVITNKITKLAINITGNPSYDRNIQINLFNYKGTKLSSKNLVLTKQNNYSKSIFMHFIPADKKYFAGRIEINISDRLPIDNTYYLAFGISKPLNVLIVSNSDKQQKWDKNPAFFVSSALQASNWIKTQRTSFDKLANRLKGSDFDAIYMCEPESLSSQTSKAIIKYLRSGNKSVMIFANLNARKFLSALLKQYEMGRLVQIINSESPYKVTEIDSSNKLIRSLGVRMHVFDKIAIGKYAQIDASNKADILLALSNGHPLLIHISMFDSNIYLFTSPARIDSGTLPLNAAFPAIVCNVAAENIAKTQNFTFRAGKSFSITVNKESKLINNKGQLVKIFKKGKNECILYDSGLYMLETHQPIAVNCASEAIDITAWHTDEINKTPKSNMLFASCSQNEIEKHLLTLAKGKSLWDYILFAVLIVMLAETFLANLRKSNIAKSTQSV